MLLKVIDQKVLRQNRLAVLHSGDVRKRFDSWIHTIHDFVGNNTLYSGPPRDIWGFQSVQYVFVQTPIRNKVDYVDFEKALYSSAFAYIEETNRPWCFLYCWDYIVTEMSVRKEPNPHPQLCGKCYSDCRLSIDDGVSSCLCQHYVEWCKTHTYCDLHISNEAPLIILN